MLRPLGDRVLIQPLLPDPPADSLILRPENALEPMPTTGKVLAVGQGSTLVRAQMTTALTSLADSIAHLQPADAADVGCGAVRKGDVLALVEKLQARLSVPSEVQVGKRVVFQGLAATDLTVDGAEYVAVREDDILAELMED